MSLDSIIIREIKPEDNAEIEALIRDVFIEFKMSLVNSTFEDEEMKDLYSYYQNNNDVFYVITLNDEVVGGGGVKPLKGHNSNVCELQKMYFSPKIRGKGYGKQLLEKCLLAAKRMGYTQCYLESAPQLKQALGLYKKYGFKPIDGALGNTGHSFCSVWMLKTL